MKDAKKSSIKKLKKNTKQIIEKDLSDKLHTFIKSLGHDVEDIGLELKKASKILAKKLVKKIGEVKIAVSGKAQSLKVNNPKAIKKAKIEIKKDVDKIKSKAKSALVKAKPVVTAIKKEIYKAEPVIVASVKKEIVKAKPLVTAVKKEISNAKPIAKSVVKSVIKKADTAKKTVINDIKKAVEAVNKNIDKSKP